MAYTAQNIAQNFLVLTNPDVGDVITNLKLQKLLYYAQGFHLAIHNAPLFGEEIEAWQYGPVVPQVYHEYKYLGSSSIPVPQDVPPVDEQTLKLLAEVYEVYGQYSALKLMNMTHSESPWIETPIKTTITHESLLNYFRPLVIAE